VITTSDATATIVAVDDGTVTVAVRWDWRHSIASAPPVLNADIAASLADLLGGEWFFERCEAVGDVAELRTWRCA
jgi:hypothetical protein